MKVYRASEDEIDKRLALDKRKSKAAFCRGFESDSEIPSGFCDLQDKIRDGLEKEFFTQFDDGIDRSNLEPRKLRRSYTLFYFPAELIRSERIIIEISSDLLDDRLLGIILAHLERCQSRYCVIAAVYLGRKIVGANYLGRFVLNLEEIAVEDSLVETWSKQVRFLEIE
jgi:hypothetical protein